MALPSSGTITIDMIRAEFGGSTPVSISQYYRGGGLVPNVSQNNAIPTSGAISFSNFYGATNQNLVPAAVNWTGIFAAEYFSGTADGATNTQTISAITENITIQMSISASISNIPKTTYDAGVYAQTGTGAQLGFVSWQNGQSGTRTASFSVSPGTTLKFYAYLGVYNGFDNTGASAQFNGTATITNTSTGGTVLDTFGIDLDAQDDGTIE